MANQLVYAVFERLWQHIKVELRNKVNQSDIPIPKDAITLCAESGLVTPIADDDNCIFTDENGVVYSL